MAVRQGAVEGLGLIGTDFSSLSGKTIFLTGHTGFKGSWLTALLGRLGCRVHGYALAPVGDPSLYTLAQTRDMLVEETVADTRDRESLDAALRQAEPDLIIHMAAQAFVRRSYAEPAQTWDVNVMGTVNVLEAARFIPSIKGVLVVTTDKCYENRAWEWGYREIDPLGGHDPYSASKAGTELVVQSYRRSFFAYGDAVLVSARAGNVIGGGDWSQDRLLADAARATLAGTTLVVRNPDATRPWQHVLDCLSGYLSIAERMIVEPANLADAYNFGPDAADNVSVGQVLSRLQRHWPELKWVAEQRAPSSAPHEASQLYLDSARARQQLGWRPVWSLDKALEQTAKWYRRAGEVPGEAGLLVRAQIDEFLA